MKRTRVFAFLLLSALLVVTLTSCEKKEKEITLEFPEGNSSILEDAEFEPPEIALPEVATGSDSNAAGLGEINVAVKEIPAGQAVLVGALDWEGKTLVIDVSAEVGTGLFVGVAKQADLKKDSSSWWIKSGGEEDSTTVTVSHNDFAEGQYYIYVGSSHTDLENVSGTITVAEK